MVTVTFSDLLRSPRKVAEQTSQGPVNIVRRDGEDLVVLRASDLEYEDEGIRVASRLVQALLTARGDLPAALTGVFPWTRLLSEAERDQFATEITEHLWSATELGHYAKFMGTVRSWRGTAEAYAAGYNGASGDKLAWLE